MNHFSRSDTLSKHTCIDNDELLAVGVDTNSNADHISIMTRECDHTPDLLLQDSQ
jgi:hypothetical protein